MTTDLRHAHEQSGRFFTADGVRSFVLERGAGAPVVCMHGVPTSSYLYRKVLAELAEHGLQGVAFDLPGLGLADRPEQFDYTWTGLGAWATAALHALGLDSFHLVVHDLGGPVGFEMAARVPERIRSLTVLNTIVDAATFRRPWAMEPFAHRGVGEAFLRTLTKPSFRLLMRLLGVADMSQVTADELDTYVDLLKRQDGGRAFLQIMRSFERTPEKSALYRSVVGSDRYPVQVVWGEQDTTLRVDGQGEQARRAAGLDAVIRLPAKHFLQEDQAPAVARHVVELAKRS